MGVVAAVRSQSVPAVRPPDWRWVHVGVAALAMVATLPGRTHGLGLITEPLLLDLPLDRLAYGAINFWATLLGAACCLPCGWLSDRLGVRVVLVGTLLALGGVVVAMARLPGGQAAQAAWIIPAFFLLVLLTRGLGQSALSVVSLALVGKAAGRRAGLPVGVYSFFVAIGFMAAFTACKHALAAWDAEGLPALGASTVALAGSPSEGPLLAASAVLPGRAEAGWRPLWGGIGLALLVLAPLAALLVRPSVSGWTAAVGESTASAVGLSLGRALRTPAFWAFALGTSLYGLIASGISLFNQSILQERGFDRDVFLNITILSPLIGLASNLLTGWLATRWPLGRLLAVALVLLVAALLAFPLVTNLVHVYLYATALGVAGGMVTVIFFAAWGQTFGPAHLGKIQGAAQMLTVLASAVGPLALAAGKHWAGSYTPLFYVLAGAAALLAVFAWYVRVPQLQAAAPVPSEARVSRCEDPP